MKVDPNLDPNPNLTLTLTLTRLTGMKVDHLRVVVPERKQHAIN